LTSSSERLVIVLVGLPGRGKSFVARKLQGFLTWRGTPCKSFNVGKYRRQATANLAGKNEGDVKKKQDADFFDPKNSATAALRQEIARVALDDTLRWLDGEDVVPAEDTKDGERVNSCYEFTSESVSKQRIAIYDATNSTIARRNWILEECAHPIKRKGTPIGVVFVESICDDLELLEENFRFKIKNSPDFDGMTTEDAIADLKKRVEKYEEQYETINDDSQSYIKIFNLSSKIMVNHIYGRMAKTIVPALMAWNIGTRPIFLCRPGQTASLKREGSISSFSSFVSSSRSKGRNVRKASSNPLGSMGHNFRDKLCDFIKSEGTAHMTKRNSIIGPSLNTGTSITGIMDAKYESTTGFEPPFPCKVMSSTMPRAVETAQWPLLPFPVTQLSCLNPLDKGEFSGMELNEICEMDPEWYSDLEKDPFHTR
jgi:predicted kinase